MFIKKKAFVLIIIYFTAAVLALGGYSLALSLNGENYRNTAVYGYEHAFGEVVSAATDLSEALRKAAYTTGASLSASVCADIYADCLAANMTMAALPFSTQELEQTAGFISIAGDYAHSLLKSGKVSGFDENDRSNFMALYETASALTDELISLQRRINDGELIMDDPENVFAANDEESLLSSAMLELESKLDFSSVPEYDSSYRGSDANEYSDPVSEKKARKIAAEFLGADADELKKRYRSEIGSTCFELEDKSIIVDGGGNVLSVSSGRTVIGDKTSDELEKNADSFLKEKGFSGFNLASAELNDGVLYLEYHFTCDGIICENDSIRLGIASDDGNLYFFDAAAHINAPEHTCTEAVITKVEAKKALPETVSVTTCKTVYADTGNAAEALCYKFSCTAENGDKLAVYVSAETGRQVKISML